MKKQGNKISGNKLSDNERRLQEAESLAKLGHWELDIVNDKLVWSDEIYRIFDTTPQSFGATYDAFLEFIHPDDRRMVNEAYQSAVENKEPYGPITHRLIMKNGVVKFVEERGTTEYDEFGEPLKSFGVVQDITERVMGEKTKALLREKEILLKEIYHRVKNNLQLVSSLLHIQALKIDDKNVKELFLNSQNRINSIALMHEQLLKSDNLSTVYIDQYVTELINNLKDSLNSEHAIQFDLDVTRSQITLDKAVPLGLIINEVITNSIKHAFPDKVGRVSIDVKKRQNGFVMNIEDNGVGIKDVDAFKKSSSFGIEIIHDLTEQLEGEFSISSSEGKGVRYQFSFLN